jgi:predicted RNase H-like HicB family nuclease
MNYTINIQENKNGWLTGQCEQLPEAISEGKNMDDLMENMKDAIELVLEYKKDKYRQQNNSNNIMPLTLKHEKKLINKTPQRKRVYA